MIISPLKLIIMLSRVRVIRLQYLYTAVSFIDTSGLGANAILNVEFGLLFILENYSKSNNEKDDLAVYYI